MIISAHITTPFMARPHVRPGRRTKMALKEGDWARVPVVGGVQTMYSSCFWSCDSVMAASTS